MRTLKRRVDASFPRPLAFFDAQSHFPKLWRHGGPLDTCESDPRDVLEDLKEWRPVMHGVGLFVGKGSTSALKITLFQRACFLFEGCPPRLEC